MKFISSYCKIVLYCYYLSMSVDARKNLWNKFQDDISDLSEGLQFLLQK